MGLFTNGGAPKELSPQDHGKGLEPQMIIWRPFRTVGMAAEQLRPSRVVIDSDPNGRYILKVNFYNSWTPEPTTHEGGSAGDGYVIFIGEEIPSDWTHLIVEKVGKKQTQSTSSAAIFAHHQTTVLARAPSHAPSASFVPAPAPATPKLS